MVCGRDRIARYKPHRVKLARLCGPACGGLLEVNARSVELSAKQLYCPEHRIEHRTDPLAPVRQARVQQPSYLE